MIGGRGVREEEEERSCEGGREGGREEGRKGGREGGRERERERSPRRPFRGRLQMLIIIETDRSRAV